MLIRDKLGRGCFVLMQLKVEKKSVSRAESGVKERNTHKHFFFYCKKDNTATDGYDLKIFTVYL